MSNFTAAERNQIQSIVATLSIKRIPDFEIRDNIKDKTHESLAWVRQMYGSNGRVSMACILLRGRYISRFSGNLTIRQLSTTIMVVN